MDKEEDVDVITLQMGSAYTLNQSSDQDPPSAFEMQRGVLVPKHYQRTKKPIGFIWSE